MNSVLTVNEVAEYLKLAPRVVARKAAGGELPAFKIGNRWRFKKDEIDRWIERQRVKGDFSSRVDRVWENVRKRAEEVGYTLGDVDKLIEEVRKDRKKATSGD